MAGILRNPRMRDVYLHLGSFVTAADGILSLLLRQTQALQRNFEACFPET